MIIPLPEAIPERSKWFIVLTFVRTMVRLIYPKPQEERTNVPVRFYFSYLFYSLLDNWTFSLAFLWKN